MIVRYEMANYSYPIECYHEEMNKVIKLECVV